MDKVIEISPENLRMQIDGFSNFDKELVAGSGVKKFMADMKASSSDLYKVRPQDITVIPGFNPRTHNRAYFEGIEELADQMVKHGYDQTKPLSIYLAKIEGQDRLVLHDGHRRHAAVLQAVEKGAPIKVVPVILKDKSDNMIDLTLGLLHSNEGEPFSTYEKAVLAKRLKKMGWENKQIAEEFNCTPAFVGQLLTMAGAPQAITSLVENGNLSATEMHRLMMEHGAEEAATIASEGMERAKAAGRTKITAKDLSPADIKAKNAKKVGFELYRQLKKLRDDPAIEKKMDDKQIETIDALIATVEKKPKVKAEPRPKKAPAAKKTPAAKVVPIAKKIADASKKSGKQIETRPKPAGGQAFFDQLSRQEAERKAGGAQARRNALPQRRSDR